MKIKIYIIIFIAFLIFSIIFVKIVEVNDNKTKKNRELLNELYFKEFNESFTGKVRYVIEISGEEQVKYSKRVALVKLKLEYSTIQTYIPPDTSEYYFCIIKYPYAEIFVSDIYHFMQPGNRVSFNGEIDSLFVETFSSYPRPAATYRIRPFVTTPSISCYKEFHSLSFDDEPLIRGDNFTKEGDYYRLQAYKSRTKQSEKFIEENSYFEIYACEYYRYFLHIDFQKYQSAKEYKKMLEDVGINTIIKKFNKKHEYISECK